jgi:tungstate transport system substrate-binding protein
MSHHFSLPSSPWPGRARGRASSPWRLLLAVALGLLTMLALGPALAQADSPNTLTVVGTSDVADSGLIPTLLGPEFQKAYPQYTFKYIGTATGTAISDAESGSVGASSLIVHAASLENQFVAGGFSYEKYGRAIFTNDFVLAGPTGDPAGAASNAANNVAQAFADVAAAGIAGKVTFVSRGGTPGTTVEEHKLWALVASSNLAPSGLLLCTVNATSGGGETPIAPNNGVTASGQPCPNGGALPTSSQLPSWYVVTGLTQGPNVVAANACNGYPSGPNSCYVLTDRGTYDYLASGTDPAGSIPSLKIVTRHDSASAPGGANELTNYFHAYIINPTKPGEAVNLPAAQAWLNFLTSQPVQAQLSTYLAHTSDPGGPPFVADASPLLSTPTGIPHNFKAGKPVTVTGTVTNAEPGFRALANVPVTINEVVGSLSVPVATVNTDATGKYSLKFSPPGTGSYDVTTTQISMIEDSTLSPPFGDLLSPAATAPATVTVHSTITNLRVSGAAGRAVVLGSVAPGTGHVKGSLTVFVAKGTKGRFRRMAGDRLGASDGNFAVGVPLAAGKWRVKVHFSDPKQVIATTFRTVKVTVAAKAPSSVTLGSVRVKSGAVTVSGSVKPAAAAGGVKVQLLGLRTAGVGAHFAVVASTTVRKGKSKFTLHAKLKRGYRWVLELKSTPNASPASLSKLRTVAVK